MNGINKCNHKINMPSRSIGPEYEIFMNRVEERKEKFPEGLKAKKD